MKIYSKIVGIILTIAGISAFIGVIAGIIDTDDIEDKIGISLLFVPCIIFLHYMYIHNFGFNLNSEIPRKKYRIILILTIISLLVSISVPVIYLSSQIQLKNEAGNMIKRDKYEHTDFVGHLKTKYENREMLYVLNILAKDKIELNSNYKTFIIELKDKDGFNIKTFEVEDITNLVEGEKRFGISSNSSEYINLKDYLKITDWNIIYRTKN